MKEGWPQINERSFSNDESNGVQFNIKIIKKYS